MTAREFFGVPWGVVAAAAALYIDEFIVTAVQIQAYSQRWKKKVNERLQKAEHPQSIYIYLYIYRR